MAKAPLDSAGDPKGSVGRRTCMQTSPVLTMDHPPFTVAHKPLDRGPHCDSACV